MGLSSRLIELIYPSRCIGCGEFLSHDNESTGKYHDSFCRQCSSDIRKITPPLCPVCGRPFTSRTIESHICWECSKRPPFYESRAAPYLYEGPLKDAIHKFKYKGRNGYDSCLGQLLADFAFVRFGHSPGLLIIPVPLHRKRLRERGYNQSLLLARYVAGTLQSRLDFFSLIREKFTSPQTGLGKRERRQNVSGAFTVVNKDEIKGKRILLIDDVATTGNTLNECSRALKKAGCGRISCLVLASTGT